MNGNPIHAPRPKKRSKLRLRLGTLAYTFIRYLNWIFGGYRFARKSGSKRLRHICFEHQTPLLRKLKDVDMYLQYNKITNLKLAAEKLNGLILRPGETLSYWKAIGKPTRRKGYREGMILSSGTFGKGIGGGLCQLSNLIYWMTLHTDLTVTERYRHSYDVFPDSNRTQPFGSGATCVYNYRDLMIKNNTGRTFQLYIKVTDKNLEGQWLCDAPPFYSYSVYEKEHSIKMEVWGGYSRNNILYRQKFDSDGNLIKDEYLTENHAMMMYAPFLGDGAQEAAADE